MELKVLDNKGKETTKSVQLDDKFLSAKASPAVLHEWVVAYEATQRAGTHSTKTRMEVSGGGIKPWRQKGTGRARAGSTRSPLWRKGGIIFGPKPRDYSQNLPKKKKRLAFQLAIQGLIKENRFQVVEPVKITEPKTKFVAEIYKKWNAPNDSFFVVDKIEEKFNRAARNIGTVKIVEAASLNVYDCLRARHMFITQAALEQLSARLNSADNESES